MQPCNRIYYSKLLFVPTHALIHFKTSTHVNIQNTKKTVKTLLVKLPLHVSVHSFDHPQGVHMPYFVLLLDWVPLVCVC